MTTNTENTRALALSRPHADLPTESDWMLIQRMARAFAASGLYPNIKNEAQAIAVVQTGRERGVPPGVALQTIKIINGVPTQAAELMAGLVQRDHGDNALRVTTCTNERCVIQYQRRGWETPGEIVFTMDDAERAGLLEKRSDQKGKSNWEKYPRAMLRSRAISEACRTAFQDTILGLYTPEEIAPDMVRMTAEGELVVDVEEAPATAGSGRVVDLHTGEVLEASAGESEAEGTQPAAPVPPAMAAREPDDAGAVGGPSGALTERGDATPEQTRTPGAADWTQKQLGARVRELAGVTLPKLANWQDLARTYGLPVPAQPGDMTQEWLLGLYQAMQTRATEERIRQAPTEGEVRTVMMDAIGLRDRREISMEQYGALDEQEDARYAELAAPSPRMLSLSEPVWGVALAGDAAERAKELGRRISAARSEEEIATVLKASQQAKDQGQITQDHRVELLRMADTRRAALSGPLTANAV